MKEMDWVEHVAGRLRGDLSINALQVDTGRRLTYGYEIASYSVGPNAITKKYQTDLLVSELLGDGAWVPRVVVEAKINSITTHDAITYTRKADSHRAVHPYLRYGVVIGNNRAGAIPGRLFRHGAGFDFMISFERFEIPDRDWQSFVKIVKDEVRASRELQKIIYDSQLPDRDRHNILQRKLILK